MRSAVSTWWVAALVALVVAGAARSHAEEARALPVDTLRHGGYPPLLPDNELVRDDEARRAWAERMLALAASTADPELGSELQLSAAYVLERMPGQRQRGYEALRLGLAARPASDPLGALARLALLHMALSTHLPDGSMRTCAEAWGYLSRPSPLDPTPEQARLDALARQKIRAEFPPLVVRFATLEGNFTKAREWARYMAVEPDPSWSQGDAERWETVAVLSHRLRDLAWARAANDKARALATDPETRARLAFWRLYLDHGMLSKEGLITQTAQVPGPTFLADLEATLRGLAGNDRVGEFLLATGSSALHARAYEVALAIYQRALQEPAFIERAWQDAGLWGGLLPGVVAALHLGRFDEAEQLLAAVERIAGERVPEADPMRVRIATARKDAAEGRPVALPPPPPPAPPPSEAPRGPRATGALELPAAPVPRPPAASTPDAAAAGEAPDDGSAWPWLALGVAAVAALLVLLRRR